MSTTIQKRTSAQAVADAEAFRAMFSDCYERWTIAGSVRRRKPEVSDIEHVVIPKFADLEGAGLFAQRTNLLWRKLDEYVAAGVIGKHVYANGFKWGDKFRGAEFRGFAHELYTTDADSWGAQLAIRTGPWEFSRHLVSEIKKHGMRNDEGCVWRGEQRVAVASEEEYFALCGVAFVEPEARR